MPRTALVLGGGGLTGIGWEAGISVQGARRGVPPQHDAAPRPAGLRITAVNAETGEFVTFTRDSGVDLVHAVAASCAVPIVWPVVLAPLPQAVSRSTRISTQLGRCRAERQVVVTPDRQSLAAFEPNVLDPTRRADAAREGLREAADVLDEVRAAWTASSAHEERR